MCKPAQREGHLRIYRSPEEQKHMAFCGNVKLVLLVRHVSGFIIWNINGLLKLLVENTVHLHPAFLQRQHIRVLVSCRGETKVKIMTTSFQVGITHQDWLKWQTTEWSPELRFLVGK